MKKDKKIKCEFVNAQQMATDIIGLQMDLNPLLQELATQSYLCSILIYKRVRGMKHIIKSIDRIINELEQELSTIQNKDKENTIKIEHYNNAITLLSSAITQLKATPQTSKTKVY